MTTLQKFQNEYYDFHLNHRRGKVGVIMHYRLADKLKLLPNYTIEGVNGEVIAFMDNVRVFHSFDCRDDTFTFFILPE